MQPERQSSPLRIVVLSLSMFSIFGTALTLTGTLLPLLIDHFRLNYAEAGTLAVSVQLGYLLSVMLAGWLAKKVDGRGLLLGALGLSAVGFGLFGAVDSFWGACLLMVVGGAGGGTIEVVINVVAMKLGKARRGNVLNFIHVFFGLGAFAGPAIIGKLINLGVPWKWFYLATGVAWGVLLLFTLPVYLPSIKQEPLAEGIVPTSVLRLPVATILFAVMTIYVGLELGVGGWMTTYLRDVEGMTTAHAAYVASAFWLGIAGGRLLLGAVSHRWHEPTIVIVLAVWAIICLLAALTLPGPWPTAIALALVGTGCSGIYPTTVSWGGGTYPAQAAQVTALLATGGGIGAVVFPWVMGYLSESFGLVNGMRFYLLMALIMLAFVIWGRTRQVANRKVVAQDQPLAPVPQERV